MKPLSLSIIAALLLAAAGLPATAEEVDKNTGIPPILGKFPHSTSQIPRGDDCVFIRTIDSWTALDDYTLIIYAPSRRHPYLVQTIGNCQGLRFETTIGLTDGFSSRLCSMGNNDLVFDNGRQRCSVAAINELTEEEAEQVRAEFKDGKYRRN